MKVKINAPVISQDASGLETLIHVWPAPRSRFSNVENLALMTVHVSCALTSTQPRPRASLQSGEAGGGSARSVHIPNENGRCAKHKTHLCSLKCAQRAETPAQLSVQKSPFVTTGTPRGPAGLTVFQPKARTFSYSVLCAETERVGRIPSAVTTVLEKAKRRRCGESGPHSQRVFLGL